MPAGTTGDSFTLVGGGGPTSADWTGLAFDAAGHIAEAADTGQQDPSFVSEWICRG
jgi:hypothetical protein